MSGVVPPLGIGNKGTIVVMHLPGVALSAPVVSVAGVWLQRMAWPDLTMLEDSELAMDLYGRWEANEHAFCAVYLPDAIDDVQQAQAVCDLQLRSLRVLLQAMRLHKRGPVLDPAESVLYTRVDHTNIRQPGLYRQRLLEQPFDTRYELAPIDDQPIRDLLRLLNSAAVVDDPAIALALRHLSWSHRYGLRLEHRAALLFIAFEATFGEYRYQSRPTPRATLGQAAAIVSRAANPLAIAERVDGSIRRYRNRIAHGTPQVEAGDAEDVEVLEDVVRDGLRAWIGFAVRRPGLSIELDPLTMGSSALSAGQAFRTLLGHACHDSEEALRLVTGLAED